MGYIILAIVLLILLGGIGGGHWIDRWDYGYGFGNSGISVIGVVLLVLLVLVLTKRIG